MKYMKQVSIFVMGISLSTSMYGMFWNAKSMSACARVIQTKQMQDAAPKRNFARRWIGDPLFDESLLPYKTKTLFWDFQDRVQEHTWDIQEFKAMKKRIQNQKVILKFLKGHEDFLEKQCADPAWCKTKEFRKWETLIEEDDMSVVREKIRTWKQQKDPNTKNS